MEELWELRQHLEAGDYGAALQVLDELDEMSRKDTIYKIQSFMEILLIHLIKQRAEQRTTRSWELSIRTSCRRIQRLNKRRKTAGWILTSAELYEALDEIYDDAMDRAAFEAFEGQYATSELAAMVNRQEILTQALALIQPV
jgi:dynactin complex subunit